MALAFWSRRSTRSYPRPGERKTPAHRARPHLEALEDRSLPSTLTVGNLSDSDPGSLRAQIAAAQTGDTIAFDPSLSGGTITLTSGELALGKSLTIVGPGAAQLAVDGGGTARVFDIAAGATVTLSGLTISGGDVEGYSTTSDVYVFGGGIYNAGTLTLSHCTVANNHAGAGLDVSTPYLLYANAHGGGLYNSGTATVTACSFADNAATWGGSGYFLAFGYGGAICNAGQLAMTDSSLDGNYANGAGGALCNTGRAAVTGSAFTNNLSGSASYGAFDNMNYGGGIDNDVGALTLTNCTIANNTVSTYNNTLGGVGRADSAGGGVYSLGDLTMLNCTVTGNTATADAEGGSVALVRGGGIFIDPSSPHGASLTNTLVAGNRSDMFGPDAFGPFASLGHNLVGQTDGSSGWVASDLTGTSASPLDARLGTLGNHGGPTQTVPLLTGSPALDAGDPAQLGTADQRGVVRSGGVNIGAFQASASAFLVSVPTSVTAGQPFAVTVTAVDRFGQTAAGYVGTVYLFSTDPQDGYLGDYPFTLADGGQTTFAGVVLAAGPKMLFATDGTLLGSLDLTVS